MKKISLILFSVWLLFSCKKGDVETPVEEVPLKGKLKTMKVDEYSTGRLGQLYTFEYVKGKLNSVDLNGVKFLEWSSGLSDSLKLEGQLHNEESEMVQTYEMYIQVDASSFIQSIYQLPNEINPELKEVFSIQKDRNALKSIKVSAYTFNTPEVPGLANYIISEQYDFQEKSIGLLMHTHYLMLMHPYVPGTKTDVIRVEFGDKKSNIPLPTQSLLSLIPWTIDLGFSSNVISYFLHLSGYQVYQNFTSLPEFVTVNGEVVYTIEYVQNSDNQVVRIVYHYQGDKAGEIELEYY